MNVCTYHIVRCQDHHRNKDESDKEKITIYEKDEHNK